MGEGWVRWVGAGRDKTAANSGANIFHEVTYTVVNLLKSNEDKFSEAWATMHSIVQRFPGLEYFVLNADFTFLQSCIFSGSVSKEGVQTPKTVLNWEVFTLPQVAFSYFYWQFTSWIIDTPKLKEGQLLTGSVSSY